MADPTMTTTTESERFSTAVVEAVAERVGVERVGVEPAGLEPPLYTAVDPDALDELLSSMTVDGNDGAVSFSYLGFEVTVHDDGSVDLEESNDAPQGDSRARPADE